MATKRYGYDAGDKQGGDALGKPRTVREPYKKGHQGYDFVDPNRGLKDLGGKIADGLARVAFGPKKKK